MIAQMIAQIIAQMITQRISENFCSSCLSRRLLQIFGEILWSTYRRDELSARPLISSQTSTGGCVMCMFVYFSLRQARATSCTHGQSRSCAFQCAAGACHFLHPWPVTLVYRSVCGRRVPLLATSDSLTNQRARQQTRQTEAELI